MLSLSHAPFSLQPTPLGSPVLVTRRAPHKVEGYHLPEEASVEGARFLMACSQWLHSQLPEVLLVSYMGSVSGTWIQISVQHCTALIFFSDDPTPEGPKTQV